MKTEVTYEVSLKVKAFHTLKYEDKKVNDIQVPLMYDDEEQSADMYRYFNDEDEAIQHYEVLISFASYSTIEIKLFKETTIFNDDGTIAKISNDVIKENVLTEE